MKELLVFFCILITFINVSYASFPIAESNTQILKTIISEDTEEDEPSLRVYILRGILAFSILAFGLYFLIRAWRREWKDIPWVKKLLRWKNIWWLLLLIPIWFILNLLASGGVGG